jgi:hypothetical protein
MRLDRTGEVLLDLAAGDERLERSGEFLLLERSTELCLELRGGDLRRSTELLLELRGGGLLEKRRVSLDDTGLFERRLVSLCLLSPSLDVIGLLDLRLSLSLEATGLLERRLFITGLALSSFNNILISRETPLLLLFLASIVLATSAYS